MVLLLLGQGLPLWLGAAGRWREHSVSYGRKPSCVQWRSGWPNMPARTLLLLLLQKTQQLLLPQQGPLHLLLVLLLRQLRVRPRLLQQ